MPTYKSMSHSDQRVNEVSKSLKWPQFSRQEPCGSVLCITCLVILHRLRQSCYDHTRTYTVPVYVGRSRPSKQGTLNQCWLNAGPPSAKLCRLLQCVVFAGMLILHRTFNSSMCETNRRGRLIKAGYSDQRLVMSRCDVVKQAHTAI